MSSYEKVCIICTTYHNVHAVYVHLYCSMLCTVICARILYSQVSITLPWRFMYLQGNGSQDQNGKDDDHAFTTVLCSARDHFTLKQDMCLSCGSYGVGEEGKLIACVQCGQCYHPYCVNIKVQTSSCFVLLHFYACARPDWQAEYDVLHLSICTSIHLFTHLLPKF